MTHAEAVQKASRDVAETLPGFDKLDSRTQQLLIEVGEEYFRAEFVPRLEGMINLSRYETAMFETTAEDRAYIEDQIEYLSMSVQKAQRAAQDQLFEKSRVLLEGKG